MKNRLLELLEICELSSQKQVQSETESGYRLVSVNRPTGTSLKYCVWKREDEVLICVRGTRGDNIFATRQNIALDMNRAMISTRDYLAHGLGVHAGFWYAAMMILRDLTLSTPGKITVTGFSLGGAVATILAGALEELHECEIELTTFASPRVGNKKFADHIEEKIPLATRVALRGDIVTSVPPAATGWRHTGKSIKLKGDGVDLKAEHSRTAYKEAIEEQL